MKIIVVISMIIIINVLLKQEILLLGKHGMLFKINVCGGGGGIV